MTSFGAVEDDDESDSPPSFKGGYNCEPVDVPFIKLVVVATLGDCLGFMNKNWIRMSFPGGWFFISSFDVGFYCMGRVSG